MRVMKERPGLQQKKSLDRVQVYTKEISRRLLSVLVPVSTSSSQYFSGAACDRNDGTCRSTNSRYCGQFFNSVQNTGANLVICGKCEEKATRGRFFLHSPELPSCTGPFQVDIHFNALDDRRGSTTTTTGAGTLMTPILTNSAQSRGKWGEDQRTFFGQT